MKGLLFGTTLSAMALGINGAWALDMQPGEWQLESPEVRIVDKTTGKLFKQEKLSAPPKRVCYTTSKVEQMQVIQKGTQLPVQGCTGSVSENNNMEMAIDSRCPTQDGSEIHTLVKYTKVSDKEFIFQPSMENTSPGKGKNVTMTFKQTFVGKKCSDQAAIQK